MNLDDVYTSIRNLKVSDLFNGPKKTSKYSPFDRIPSIIVGNSMLGFAMIADAYYILSGKHTLSWDDGGAMLFLWAVDRVKNRGIDMIQHYADKVNFALERQMRSWLGESSYPISTGTAKGRNYGDNQISDFINTRSYRNK